MVDQELLESFITEGRDSLDEIEPFLIELGNISAANGEMDPEVLATIFRAVHSLKGSASFLSLDTVAAVVHEAETLLDLFRKGKARVTPEDVTLLCRTIDFLRMLFDHIEETNSDEGFEDKKNKLVEDLTNAVKRATSGNGEDEKEKESTQVTDSLTDSESKSEQNNVSEGYTRDTADTEESLPEEFSLEITDELRTKFVQEADELLDLAEANLLEMEKDPGKAEELCTDTLRALHSIKGNAGFMALADIEKLSHSAEEALEDISEGIAECSPNNIKVLLEVIDTLRESVADVSKGGKGKIEALDLMLDFMNDMFPRKGDATSSVPDKKRNAPTDGKKQNIEEKVKQEDISSSKTTPPETTRLKDSPDIQKKAIDIASKTQKLKITRKDIRVDIRRLDALINLIGELVIAEAMVTRHPVVVNAEDESLEKAVHLLRRISSDLQDVAMSTRMIPLAATFRKMIRLVHDLSRKSGKKIELVLLGEETEVDKTVIEQIADPLVHIVRNAADHGIEPPDERKATGKPELAKITIEAKHEGGEVWILISDDGRGLNREKILKKGIEKGLITEEESKVMSDENIFRLIFEPGFSTADKVTDISGRGVGMDVVKKNIEKLKGKIDVKSTTGKGSTFILRIPLTLAIIDGMLIRVGKTKYTVPLLAIRESFRPTKEQITNTPDGKEIVRVREDFFPVVRLHKIFNCKPDSENLEEGILIIIEGDREGESIALFVDEVLGQQQTVIKGLNSFLAKARGISGCTILGDGQVSLIIDPGSLVSMVK